MIGTGTDGVRIWVATAPVDMRKSFDGLMEVVADRSGRTGAVVARAAERTTTCRLTSAKKRFVVIANR